MPYSRKLDDQGILITTFSGDVRVNESIELQNELVNYSHNGEIYELVLHPDGVNIEQNIKDSEASAENARSAMKKLKRGAIAFVSNSDYAFGILRQLQMRVENDFIQMAVFRNEETARKWLLEMKNST